MSGEEVKLDLLYAGGARVQRLLLSGACNSIAASQVRDKCFRKERDQKAQWRGRCCSELDVDTGARKVRSVP